MVYPLLQWLEAPVVSARKIHAGFQVSTGQQSYQPKRLILAAQLHARGVVIEPAKVQQVSGKADVQLEDGRVLWELSSLSPVTVPAGTQLRNAHDPPVF